MKPPKNLIFTVTNDLSYDQRMIRICTSLAHAGYQVSLIGRKLPASIPLTSMPFRQFRIHCFFIKGFGFYAEFNIRLFFYLIYKKANLVCAVDLDTVLPCFLASVLKNIPRVYDAHELFCEMKEIVSRPRIHAVWKQIEKTMVPRFMHGYAVNQLVAGELRRMYNVRYETIRNLPVPSLPDVSVKDGKYIIYQGAVNEGRCFESVLPAMTRVDAKLIVCGDGNFMKQAKQIAADLNLDSKVVFTGWLAPEALKYYTRNAYIGLNIIEDRGLNNRYSLSNRFFDYIQAALPQICVNYPAYREINDEYNCAYMIDDTDTETIAGSLNKLLADDSLYNCLRSGCIMASKVFNWTEEEKKLLSFYKNIPGIVR